MCLSMPAPRYPSSTIGLNCPQSSRRYICNFPIYSIDSKAGAGRVRLSTNCVRTLQSSLKDSECIVQLAKCKFLQCFASKRSTFQRIALLDLFQVLSPEKGEWYFGGWRWKRNRIKAASALSEHWSLWGHVSCYSGFEEPEFDANFHWISVYFTNFLHETYTLQTMWPIFTSRCMFTSSTQCLPSPSAPQSTWPWLSQWKGGKNY